MKFSFINIIPEIPIFWLLLSYYYYLSKIKYVEGKEKKKKEIENLITFNIIETFEIICFEKKSDAPHPPCPSAMTQSIIDCISRISIRSSFIFCTLVFDFLNPTSSYPGTLIFFFFFSEFVRLIYFQKKKKKKPCESKSMW